jgi:hypothetical protein
MRSCPPDGPGRGSASHPHYRAGRGDASVGCPRGRCFAEHSRRPAVELAPSPGLEPRSSLPARAPPCPKQRSATVASGQQRSPSEAPDLCHCRTASSPTILPKLVVVVLLGALGHKRSTTPDNHGHEGTPKPQLNQPSCRQRRCCTCRGRAPSGQAAVMRTRRPHFTPKVPSKRVGSLDGPIHVTR